MSDLHAESGPVGSVRSRARASYATSFVPEPANISTFPPIAADCTSFAARSPSEKSSMPRDGRRRLPKSAGCN